MTSANSALRPSARSLRRRSSALVGIPALRALGVRPFRVYAIAQGFTSFGIWVQGITQDWLVLTLTHSALAVGLTAAFQFLPVLLLGPFGGAFADRLPRRRLLLCTQPLTCLLAGCTASIVLLGHPQTWQIYVLAVLAGLIWVVDNPTRQALVSDLVPATRLRSAVALNSSISQLARIVAPAVAGTLITTVGCGAALCVDTLFFTLGAFAWSRLRVAPAAGRGPEQEQAPSGDGSVFRYLHREPRIALTIFLVGVVGTFGLNFPVVLTVIAQRDFSGSADLYGVFNLMLALGSIAGALIAAGKAQARLVQIIGLCAVFGAVQLAGAFTGDLLAFLACLVALGASNLAFQTVANSAVQLWTEPRWRGRVLGVYGQLFVGGTPLGAPLIGALTAREGGRVGMAVCGGVPLAAAVILAAVLASRRERGDEERVSRAALERVVRPASRSTQKNRPTRPEKAGKAAERRARCVRHGESARLTARPRPSLAALPLAQVSEGAIERTVDGWRGKPACWRPGSRTGGRTRAPTRPRHLRSGVAPPSSYSSPSS